VLERMKTRSISFLMMFLTALYATPRGSGAQEGPASLDVDALLRRVDDVRSPRGDFSVDTKILAEAPDGKTRESRYEVLMNADRDALVKTVYPANERGQAMLMKGRDLWLYLPNVDQPVRLSLSQRLSGQVSNGDIARMNFSGDYKGTLSRIEEMSGAQVAVLDLKAVGPWVTYGKVILWVSVSDAHPRRAEFYTTSDILIKTCEFTKYAQMEQESRPVELIFKDALQTGGRSVLSYSSMKRRKLPNRYFSKEYMQKLD